MKVCCLPFWAFLVVILLAGCGPRVSAMPGANRSRTNLPAVTRLAQAPRLTLRPTFTATPTVSPTTTPTHMATVTPITDSPVTVPGNSIVTATSTHSVRVTDTPTPIAAVTAEVGSTEEESAMLPTETWSDSPLVIPLATPLALLFATPHATPLATPVGGIDVIEADIAPSVPLTIAPSLPFPLTPALVVIVPPTSVPENTDPALLFLPTLTPTPILAQPVAAQDGGESEPAPEIETEAEIGATHSITDSIAEQLQMPVENALLPELAIPILPAQNVVSASDGVARTVQVPILMYHYLSVPPPDANIYRIDLSVAPDFFAAHLDAMQQAGYTPISFYHLLEHLNTGAPLPEKPVILTFDDGYRDNYENAFPLLRERSMTATFFVVTDFIDEQRPEYLTWDMVREMYASGMSIESHGRNHVSLKNKERDYLIWQALGSLETIEYEIGQRPRFVSYPAGEFDQATLDVFQSAGYGAGATTVQGATHSNQDLFRLQRVRVRGSTTPEELLRILALDW